MSKTGYASGWESAKGQINKLPRSKQKVTGPLKLECHGILRDLGTTKKSAGIAEH